MFWYILLAAVAAPPPPRPRRWLRAGRVLHGRPGPFLPQPSGRPGRPRRRWRLRYARACQPPWLSPAATTAAGRRLRGHRPAQGLQRGARLYSHRPDRLGELGPDIARIGRHDPMTDRTMRIGIMRTRSLRPCKRCLRSQLRSAMQTVGQPPKDWLQRRRALGELRRAAARRGTNRTRPRGLQVCEARQAWRRWRYSFTRTLSLAFVLPPSLPPSLPPLPHSPPSLPPSLPLSRTICRSW